MMFLLDLSFSSPYGCSEKKIISLLFPNTWYVKASGTARIVRAVGLGTSFESLSREPRDIGSCQMWQERSEWPFPVVMWVSGDV